MRSFAFFLVVIAVAYAAVTPTSPPGTECARYQLFTSGNLMLPSSVPNYVPNTLVYSHDDLMMGTPQGPFFSVRSDDCFWVPNGAFNCAIDLYLDSAHSTLIGSGTLNSSSLAVQGISTVVGFHLVSGTMQLTTTITNSAFTAPQPSVNFQALSTSIYFPAEILLPEAPSTAAAVANGVSYVGSSEFLTLWGSNGGWNGTTWGASRTTGLDLRASLVCNPPNSGRPTGSCPSCPNGNRVVPAGCISSGASIAQTVPGNCIALSFSSSSSTTSDNGCSSGSF